MNFDNFSESGSVSSEEEGSIIDQIVKTKSQTTKFFNDLNKHQKSFNKRIMFNEETSKRINNRKRDIRESPTYK